MRNHARSAFAAATLLLAANSACRAAGYQRGIIDTDILYEPGAFSTRMSFTYIEPQRGFETINGVAGDYGTYTGRYRIPSLAVKLGGEGVACAGTYVQSFAAEADYTGAPGGALPAATGTTLGSRNRGMSFESDEVAATCRVSYEDSRGRFSLLGGVYLEDFDFSASSLVVAPSGQLAQTPYGAMPIYMPADMDVDAHADFDPGFRVGAAYERPDIALRAEVLYRSQTTHEAPDGSAFGVLGGSPFLMMPGLGRVDVPSPIPIGTPLPIPEDFRLSDVVSPQSLSVNLQTGIAAGTLLIGSFRWTDWSTNRELLTQVGDNPANRTPFFWDDGYTATLGIGRALSDSVSALASVGYDSGVSTGAETTYTDLYTLSGGLSLKQGFGEARIGGLVGYWTSGKQSVSDNALFDATVGDDWVYAASATLKLTF